MVEDGQVPELAPEQPEQPQRGRLVRFARAVRRHWPLTAVAVLVVAAGGVTAAVVLPGGYGETITGPFGAFPAPVASAGQPHVLTHYYGPVTLDGGVAVVGDGNRVRAGSGTGTTAVTGGVAAVSLRTGRMYWSYQRPGHAVLEDIAYPSGVYVLWDDGLLVQINPRTAAIAWHHTVSTPVNPDAEVLATSGPAQQGTVLVVAGGIDAVSQASGSPLWSVAPLRGCEFHDPALTADTIVVTQINGPGADTADCPADTPLRGYAVPDGHLRWQQPNFDTNLPILPVSPHLIVVEGARQPGDQFADHVLDADSGRVVRAITANYRDGIVDGDGLVFGFNSSSRPLEAWDAASGRSLWQQALPHGENLLTGPFLAGSSTADLVTSSPGPAIPDGQGDGKTVPSVRLWLYRYDARTGRLLSRTSLPLLNLARGDAASLAKMQAGATVTPVSGSGGVTAFIETNPYQEGVAAGNPLAVADWPDLVVLG